MDQETLPDAESLLIPPEKQLPDAESLLSDPLPKPVDPFMNQQRVYESRIFPAVGRILNDTAAAAKDAFKAQGEASNQRSIDLQNIGLINKPGESSRLKGAFEAAYDPASAIYDTMMASGAALIAGFQGGAVTTGQETGMPALGRDIAMIPEALPQGTEGMGVHLPHINEARAHDVVGVPESVYMGTKEATPEQQVQAQQAAASIAPEPQEPAPLPLPDIHQMARNIAPETFARYDALDAMKDKLRAELSNLVEQRQADAEASSPYAAEIADLQEKLQDANPRKTKIYEARLAELTDLHDEHVSNAIVEDTAAVREQIQKTDYAMRDLAPDVSSAYRAAGEFLPDEEPQEAPVAEAPQAATEAQPTEAPAEPVPTETPTKPIEEQHAAIVSDVSKKLIAAGRPAEEANAAAQLVAEHYKAAAEQGWAKGTPEEIYQRDGANIKAGKTRAKEMAQPRTLYQAAKDSIDKVIESANEQGNSHQRSALGGVSDWLAAKAKEAGLDISGYKHTIDTYAVKHVRLKHGDESTESSRGQIVITDDDIRQIPDILSAPDKVVFGTKNKHGKEQVVYLKMLPDGSTLFLEEVRTGKKELAATSMRKYPATTRATSIMKSLDLNGQTDSGASLIIHDVPKDSSAIAEGKTLYQAARGKIRLATDAAKATITLMKTANASTFIHETGHHWLEEMMRYADAEHAPEGLKKDAETVRKWLGVAEGEEIATRQHEKFARGFERYMMEGTAPSRALANVFAKFKQWLTGIYQTVEKLKSPITPDIRDVFDRLLSSKPEKIIIAPEHEPGKMLADIHVADAKTTPPEHKDKVGDTVETEIDHTAKLHEPEVADAIKAAETGSVPSQASGDQGNAGAGQPAGESNAAQAFGTFAAGSGGPEARGAGTRAANKLSPYEKIPKEPTRLTDWVKKNGGLKDEGGDIRSTLGGAKFRPGLIKKAGRSGDDLAMAAWEAGYFPEKSERPTLNEFLDKLNEDIRGKPQYSMHDNEAANAYRDALAKNDETDRIAADLGIDTTGKTHDQFWDEVAEKMSIEKPAQTIAEQDAIHIDAFKEAEKREKEWLESKGEAWEPEETKTRTLEDLENERRQENASREPQQGDSGAEQGGFTPAYQGAIQESSGQRGRGIEPARSADAPESTGTNPNASFGKSKSDLVDKAGNIRLDLLNTTSDIDEVLRQTANDNGGFMAERRGVIPNGTALNLADALGLDASQLNMRKVGEAYSAEQIIAATKLLIQSANELSEASKSGDLAAYLEVRERHKMIQGHVAGITAEAGRALQVFQALKRIEGYDKTKAMGEFLKDNDKGKTLFQLQEEMQFASKLETAQQLSKFVEDSKKAKFKDMVLEYYINALISGPMTHFRYAVGNAVNALATPLLEIPSSAALGALRSEKDRVYIGEAGAQLYALGKGSRDGLVAAIKAFKESQSPLLPTERASAKFMEGHKNAIPGVAGEVINLPSRSVSAIHSFFKTLRYEQNIAGLAYRQAMKEGLEGEALNKRIADLTTRPTDTMMQSATQDALKELYMAPTEYHSAMGHLTQFTNSWMPAKIIMPFMKIGSQITRNAFMERTLLGVFSKDIRANLSGVNGKEARDLQAGKIMVGTSLAAVTSLMVMEGIATGDGPTDPKQRAVWLLTHKANTMTVGNLTIPYQGLGAFGMLMRFSANMTETAHGWGEADGEHMAKAFMEGMTKSVLDDNFMRGVKDMLDAVYHPDEYGDRYLQSFATNWLPFSVGLGQVDKMQDTYQRRVHSEGISNAYGIMDAARAKIPFVSESLMPKRDMFGNPIKNGSSYEQYKSDPVVQRLEALHTGIGQLSRKINGVQLTDAQYDDYSMKAGKLTHMMLANLIQPGFQFQPAGLQIKMIDKTIETARETARNMVKFNPANLNILQQAIAAKQAVYAK
jgi:hypothetical protein